MFDMRPLRGCENEYEVMSDEFLKAGGSAGGSEGNIIHGALLTT